MSFPSLPVSLQEKILLIPSKTKTKRKSIVLEFSNEIAYNENNLIQQFQLSDIFPSTAFSDIVRVEIDYLDDKINVHIFSPIYLVDASLTLDEESNTLNGLYKLIITTLKDKVVNYNVFWYENNIIVTGVAITPGTISTIKESDDLIYRYIQPSQEDLTKQFNIITKSNESSEEFVNRVFDNFRPITKEVLFNNHVFIWSIDTNELIKVQSYLGEGKVEYQFIIASEYDFEREKENFSSSKTIDNIVVYFTEDNAISYIVINEKQRTILSVIGSSLH